VMVVVVVWGGEVGGEHQGGVGGVVVGVQECSVVDGAVCRVSRGAH